MVTFGSLAWTAPCVVACLALAGSTGAARAQGPGPWSDSFENYAAGSTMPGQGGWEEWDMQIHVNPGTVVVSPVAAQHGAKYMMVKNDADTIRRYTGYTSGTYSLNGWMYLPSTLVRPAYWIVLNTYNHFGPYHWSCQIRFNEPTFPQQWCIDAGSACTAMGTYPQDQWFEIRVDVDLAADKTSVYLDGTLMAPAYSWQSGVFGAGGGAPAIACLDAYASGTNVPSDESYFDDFNLLCAGNVSIYCTAKVNSSGCTPALHFVGFPVADSEGGFDIFATEILNTKFGLLFYGKSGPQAAPFQGGILCVNPPHVRTLTQNSGSGGTPPCGGFFQFDFNTYILSGADPALVAGQSVWGQFWSRDPGFAPPNNTNLTNAIEFTICEDPPPFKNMAWSNTQVVLSNAGLFNHTATLNGLITVNSNAAPNGSVVVAFDDGSMATVQQMPSGSTLILTGGSTLNLLTPGSGPGDDAALINGNPTSIQAILSGLETSLSQGVSPNAMPPPQRAMLALGAVARTNAWTDNVVVAKLGFLGDSWVSWCKSSVIAALSSLSLSESTICSVDCAAGGTVTLGGWRVPCAELCIAGSFIGLSSARTVLESLWNP